MRPIGVAIVVGVVVSSTSALAEAPTTTTVWYFRQDYPSGQYADSTDPSLSGQVLMYSGSKWRCQRQAMSLTTGGKLHAGYVCENGSGFAQALASCNASSPDADRVPLSIGDGSGWINLLVRCETIQKQKPSPPKSADKNL